MNIHRLYIALTLLAVSTVSKAQFIDLEWNATDSVPPSYTHSYDLGYDYLDKECRFVMEYTEYQIATEEEIKRYGVDVEALSDSFPVVLRKTVSKKRGSLEVAVYPFAKKGEDVVKLLSLKPVVTMLRQSTPPRRMENAASRYLSSPQASGLRFMLMSPASINSLPSSCRQPDSAIPRR